MVGVLVLVTVVIEGRGARGGQYGCNTAFLLSLVEDNTQVGIDCEIKKEGTVGGRSPAGLYLPFPTDEELSVLTISASRISDEVKFGAAAEIRHSASGGDIDAVNTYA